MPNYPYVSGQAPLVAAFDQLRRGFPSKVDAGYLKRFNIAPSNESYVIAILKFLELLDDEGNRVEAKTGFFYGNDESFASGLEEALRNAYPSLFEEMGDGALAADKGRLAHWFRGADKTTELVGQRQASTFQTLAALAGHRELPASRSNSTKKASGPPTASAKKASNKKTPDEATRAATTEITGGAKHESPTGHDVTLAVRIEVNLPAGGDSETYDAIFASIKKHLMS